MIVKNIRKTDKAFGMTISEFFALKHKDIDFERKEIHIRREAIKIGERYYIKRICKEKTVPLPESLEAILPPENDPEEYIPVLIRRIFQTENTFQVM